MNQTEKKNYNKAHYQRNRDAILAKAKARTSVKTKSKPSVGNVISLFKKTFEKQLPTDKNPKVKTKPFSTLTAFLGLLSVMIVFFLIKEMSVYYVSLDGSWAEAILKASILEGVVLVFTLVRPKTKLLSVSYRVMTGLIFLYTVWVLSGSVVQAGLQDEMKMRINSKAVQELEAEISKKEAFRDTLLNANRTTLAAKYDRALDALREKLNQARKIKIQIQDSFSIWNRTLTLIVFRTLVMFANLLVVRELSRRFQFQTKLQTLAS